MRKATAGVSTNPSLANGDLFCLALPLPRLGSGLPPRSRHVKPTAASQILFRPRRQSQAGCAGRGPLAPGLAVPLHNGQAGTRKKYPSRGASQSAHSVPWRFLHLRIWRSGRASLSIATPNVAQLLAGSRPFPSHQRRGHGYRHRRTPALLPDEGPTNVGRPRGAPVQYL